MPPFPPFPPQFYFWVNKWIDMKHINIFKNIFCINFWKFIYYYFSIFNSCNFIYFEMFFIVKCIYLKMLKKLICLSCWKQIRKKIYLLTSGFVYGHYIFQVNNIQLFNGSAGNRPEYLLGSFPVPKAKCSGLLPALPLYNCFITL